MIIAKMINENKIYDNEKRRTHNERFCVIAAVSPQIMQWELASYYPAGSSVEAATTQSRHHALGVSGGQGGGKWLRNRTITSERPDILYN